MTLFSRGGQISRLSQVISRIIYFFKESWIGLERKIIEIERIDLEHQFLMRSTAGSINALPDLPLREPVSVIVESMLH